MLEYNPDVVNGVQSTDAFDHLQGTEIRYTIAFEVADESFYDNFSGDLIHELETGPAEISFTGDVTGYLNDVVGSSLSGQPFTFSLSNRFWGDTYFDGINFVGATGAEFFGFEIGPISVALPLDPSGFAVWEPFAAPGHAILRRYTSPPFTMTDCSSGDAVVEGSGG